MYGYKIFHEQILKNLLSTVRNGTAAHAYIFEGASGLFLSDAAKLFAMALTCQTPSAAPCCSCHACIESTAGTNPDIIFVKPESGKKTFGVSVIRQVNDDTCVKPFHSPKKVYIIENGDILTAEAQNALLKTLEEPPEYTVFIIITSNKSFMLETVLSRSEIIYFPPVSDKLILRYIDESFPDTENPDLAVALAQGIPGEIDKMAEDENFYALRSASADILPSLLTKNMLKAFSVKNFLTENKDDADKIFDTWILLLRDILVLQAGAFDHVINHDKLPLLRDLSNKLDQKVIASAIDEIFKAKAMLARNVSLKSVALALPLKINR